MVITNLGNELRFLFGSKIGSEMKNLIFEAIIQKRRNRKRSKTIRETDRACSKAVYA